MPPAVWTRLCFSLLILSGAVAHAAQPAARGTVFEIPVPGGLRPILALVDDPLPPDRAQFLLEFIRRVHQTPIGPRNDPREPVLRSVLAQLDKSATLPPGAAETVPLPLSPSMWTDVIFGGRVSPANLVSGILRSRNTALLYYGLLSLDDGTREWLTAHPDLIADIAARHAPAFAAAAGAIRVANGVVRVPGGDAAEPIWQALTGRRPNEPVDFVRALLSRTEGQLALTYVSLSELTPAQVRFVLDLDADANARVDAGRRLFAVFERLTSTWNITERTFTRPFLDPALLAADLRADAGGRPILPGGRRFWSAALNDPEAAGGKGKSDDPSAFADDSRVDFAWLCEEIFKGDQVEQRRKYGSVLFASRNFDRISPELAADTVETIRAFGSYPALVATLERAKLTDVGAFARAARRAAQLTVIGDDSRAARAIAQFQGALALVVRATRRGSVARDALPALVTSLASVDVTAHGDYEGRISRWLDANLRGPKVVPPPVADVGAMAFDDTTGPVEYDLLRILAGRAPAEPRMVEWEGTRYRVDFAAAEAARLARVMGEHPRPYLSAARTLLDIADALEGADHNKDALRRHAAEMDRVAQDVDWPAWQGTDAASRYQDAAAALQRATRDGEVRVAQPFGQALRLLADDLSARGLTDLAYAAALGQPDGGTVLASDAARRHDFGTKAAGGRRSNAWRMPVAGAGTSRGWHVNGSLLALDVSLADFALVRLSSKPPSKRPTLNEDDRRAFTEAVPIVDAASLTDDAADALVRAIRRGRERLDAAKAPSEAVALADEIHLSGARRTLLPWVIAHEPGRAAAFLSPVELFWLGLEHTPVAASAQPWGAPAGPRLGCLCLQLTDRRAWETLTGRWSSGIFATTFPDLNLRLAELLADLHMPPSLLAPVLASATLDFINTVTSRDQDDHRGLVEFVRALRADRVEQYLALLTTDGPLLPVSQTVQTSAKAGLSR